MIEWYVKAQAFVHEMQVTVAVLFGMFVQFFLGKTKNSRVAVTVVVSSLFVALYIVPPFIEWLKFKPDGAFAISTYALSSVLSIEILSFGIWLLPAAARKKAEEYLGVTQQKEEENEN